MRKIFKINLHNSETIFTFTQTLKQTKMKQTKIKERRRVVAMLLGQFENTINDVNWAKKRVRLAIDENESESNIELASFDLELKENRLEDIRRKIISVSLENIEDHE